MIQEINNAQSIVTSQNCSNTEVSKKEVITGVFKYSAKYSMLQDELPKIQNIVLYKNFSVSIDFYHQGNLTPIHQALNMVAKSLGINVSYVEDTRKLSMFDVSSKSNQVIRIDSNVVESIYYLHHLYSPVSCIAAQLIFSVMFDSYKFKNQEFIEQIREQKTLDLDIFADQDDEDDQVLLDYTPNNFIYNVSTTLEICSDEQKYVVDLKKVIRETPLEEKEKFIDMTINMDLMKSMYEDLSYFDPKLVYERTLDKTHQKVAAMLDDSDQCLSYLNTTYPELYPAVTVVMNKMNDTITNLENKKGNELYYKTMSWTSDALDYVSDNIVTKIISYGSLITSVGAAVCAWKFPESKEALKGVKEISGLTKVSVATLEISNSLLKKYLLPPETVTVNHEELIKHFTCKFTLSNGNKRLGDLDEQGLEIVGDVFGKYVYYTTTQDSQKYPDQSTYTNYLLDQLSNITHIENIKIDNKFNNITIYTNDNEAVILQDLIGHYNESACFDNIII